jgi:carboxyl-terminal processing protease
MSSPYGSAEATTSKASRRQVLLGLGAGAAIVGAGMATATFVPPGPRRYLNHALATMQQHSLHRKAVDWKALRRAAIAEIANAKTVADTYPAIRNALKRLNDGHSVFVAPSDMERLKNNASAGTNAGPSPRSQRLDDSLGYVLVPSFSSLSPTALVAFAEQVQGLIRDVDAGQLKGWIVDLRANPGGNMWPMVLGLGPILGDGLLGSFVDAKEGRSDWFLENGAVSTRSNPTKLLERFHNTTILRLRGAPYRLLNNRPPVAVLTGPYTASSGEATCVAFRGRPRTASFGLPTFGVSTSNGMFTLADGAAIFLTTAVMADRTGRKYGAKIAPDYEIAGETSQGNLDTDAVVQAAASWLKGQAEVS